VREAFSWIEKHALHNAYALHMNAENMGLPNGFFDLALCGFMGWDYCFDFVRGEFTGPDTRMREVSRVLRDGGRVGISTWEQQADLDWMEQKFIGAFPSIASDREFIERRPIGYSKESAHGYDIILRSAGFEDVEIFREKVAFVSTDEEEWWEQMRSLGWYRYFERTENEGVDKLERFKESVFRDLQRHKHADGIQFSKSVAFVFGAKRGSS
jgi:SAM-dependent methyltransferase